MQYAGTTGLVTGASSGLGAESARRLARRGADVVLVARRPEALDSLAADIRAATGRTVRTVPFGLATERSGYRLADRVAGAGDRRAVVRTTSRLSGRRRPPRAATRADRGGPGRARRPGPEAGTGGRDRRPGPEAGTGGWEVGTRPALSRPVPPPPG
ncbi:hypothetical protein GCM10023082_13680 [Streptomyces tremellae]|uniref:Ketoreductase (KR) domain-containing protein n=1 Tax=Streptomyces tremellae TaxID=1124239 RepID=A0ABP7EFR5_9ACTN